MRWFLQNQWHHACESTGSCVTLQGQRLPVGSTAHLPPGTITAKLQLISSSSSCPYLTWYFPLLSHLSGYLRSWLGLMGVPERSAEVGSGKLRSREAGLHGQPSLAPEARPHLRAGWVVNISYMDLSGLSGVFTLGSSAPVRARGLFWETVIKDHMECLHIKVNTF